MVLQNDCDNLGYSYSTDQVSSVSLQYLNVKLLDRYTTRQEEEEKTEAENSEIVIIDTPHDCFSSGHFPDALPYPTNQV